MPDAPDHLWPFWRDKLGAEAALREHFPERLRRDPRLQSALQQLDTARAGIEYIMGSDPNDQSDTGGPAHEGDEADPPWPCGTHGRAAGSTTAA